MAIAFDTTTLGGVGSSSWTHVCTGSNLFLAVVVQDTAGGSNVISGVTYNGVSMTSNGTPTADSNGDKLWMFYLINPASGSNTVSISYSSSGTFARGCSASYTGVKQSGQPDSHQYALSTASGTSVSVVNNVVATGCWIIQGGGSASTTVGSLNGSASRQSVNGSGNFGGKLLFSDTNATVSTGNNTSTLTGSNLGTGQYFAIHAISISPAPAPLTNGNFLALM